MSLEGQQIGRYRLLRPLGSGGMGEVYLASDTVINRQVAIKVIRTDVTLYRDNNAVKEAARLFQREAQAIALLDHPHILPLFDYGEARVSGEGDSYAYMVMPFRQEGSFAAWLRQRDSENLLSLDEVVHVVRQVAGALQYAHDHQIIHQDVKPSNFLIRIDRENPNLPDLLLADFGVAKFSTGTAGDSQAIRGTPTYMAPEQWEGHAVPATDQYALAVMVYELLTGRPVFQASLMQVIYQHIHTQPQAPSTLNSRIPGEVDVVLLRALAKKPEDRFPSISAFAQAFQQAVHSKDASTIVQAEHATHGGTRDEDLATFYNQADHDLTTITSRSRSSSGDNAQPYADSNKALLKSHPTPYGRDESGPYNIRAPIDAGQRRKLPIGMVILLIALVLLLIGGGAGIVYYVGGLTSPSQGGANATATAQIRATEQANNTATAIAGRNPYTHTGSLVLSDPLGDNNKGFQWEEGLRDMGFCQFQAGAYHAIQSHQGFFHSCIALNTDFSDFAYEVQMTLISGDYGGIVFRADRATTHFYYFRITPDGNYELRIYVDKNPADSTLLSKGTTSSINVGLNQPNLIAVVAQSSNLDLYVNHQRIASVNDGTYSHGQIGVFVGDFVNSADAVFSSAKVWTF